MHDSSAKPTNSVPDNAVAIVGLALRVPGANDPESFWKNLAAGKETISHFKREELECPEEFDRPDYVPAKGIVENVEDFDASFFGMLPREAEVTDPQQRVFLELAWEAMERSGYRPGKDDLRVGVYASAYMNSYMLANLCSNREFLDETVGQIRTGSLQTEIGNDKDYLATRVSFKLNLKGPSVTVGTACSGSLVAVAEACRAIREGVCDMALAGGVAITVPQKRGYIHTEKSITSVDGHCRVFDEDASGTVFSNGAGVVMLKRYQDAVRDGNHIHAVIRGFGVNNDGNNKLSYAAPSVKGQVEVIRLAQEDAGVAPETITAIETHGTGTPLGDPIEVRSLARAYKEAGVEKTQFCSLGSLKSYIGHLDVASGVCGLIKMALSLEKKKLPPLLHFQKAHPKIDFENGPFVPAKGLQDWRSPDASTPLRGAVSSFGVGGTNAHVVLEEAPNSLRKESHRSQQLLVFSAKSESAVGTMANSLGDYFNTDRESLSLAETAQTLAKGRKEFPFRKAIVAENLKDLSSGLENANTKPIRADLSKAPINFLFSGQGSQHVNMARTLYDSEPRFRQVVDRCCEVLEPAIGMDLRDLLFPSSNANFESLTEQLKDTRLAQPAIFVIEYAIADLWMHWGIRPAAMIGHSVGEFVAACHAGVFQLDDILRTIAKRGRLMSDLPGGGMLSVRLPEIDLLSRLPETLDLAAVNGPSLCVVAGPQEELDQFQRALEAENVVARPLHTSHAFHSRMMDSVVEPFLSCLSEIELHSPNIPILSTVTGKWLTDEQATDPAYWANHLRNTVRFSEAVSSLGSDSEKQIFIEAGPGQTLTTLALQILERKNEHVVVPSCLHATDEGSDYRNLLGSLGKLWERGIAVNWDAFYSEEPKRTIPLPTYPFERKRYWIEPTPATQPQAPPIEVSPISISPEPNQTEEPTETAPAMSSVVPRIETLRKEVRKVLTNLSGMPEDELHGDATFLELGFDSLLLTQVSKAFQDEFGTTVNMRQLITDIATIDAFSAHLDETLEPARYRDTVAPPIVPEATELPPIANSPAPIAALPTTVPTAAPTGDVQALIAQQMELMKTQLAILQGQSIAPQQLPAKTPPTVAKAPTPPPEAPAKPASNASQSSAPSTTINREMDDTLSPSQREYLRNFIAEYTARTATSKELTAQYRQWYADPRTVSGFNPLWKEMIYQIVVTKSKGTRLLDVDGNEYIDMLNGFGPGFLGHSPDFITEALHEKLDLGMAIGPQCLVAMEASKLFCEVTGNERASFVNTGSEGVQAAMRLARTVTGRDKIVMFAKDYHGNFDEVLVRGVGTDDNLRSMPVAPGIPNRAVDDMIVLPYGKDESLEYIRTHGHELAAVMVEPVQSRMPEFQPKEFLQALRKITTDSGSALIFDEVITGFRAGPRGAQGHFEVEADIACYGKIIGGGMPIGVVAGKAEFMDTFDGGMWQYGDDSMPEKGVTFFAGTFVRHPLAMVAVKQMLLHLKERGEELWVELNSRAERLATTINDLFLENDIPFRMPRFKSVMYLRHIDDNKYANLLFFHLRKKGVFLLEGFPCYLTTAHTDDDIDYVISAFRETIAEMQEAGFFPRPANTTLPTLNGSRLTSPPRQLGTGEETEVPSTPIEPETYPLTEPLTELWLASRVNDSASLCFNEVVALSLKGALDLEALEEATQNTVKKHEALRAIFPENVEGFRIQPFESFGLEVSNEASSDNDEKEQVLQSYLDRERATPFPLTDGPLYRFRLVSFSDTEHTLIFNAHHLVCDGWSCKVILDDIAESYEAFSKGLAPSSSPSLRFGSYAKAVVREEKETEGGTDEKYWLSRFEEAVPSLDLPLDHPRPEEFTYRSENVRAQIDESVVRELKSQAARMGTTLFSLLLGAYQALLHRISNKERILVAFPSAGQNRPGKEDLVGHCVNFLPLVADINPSRKFSDFLNDTQGDLLDALEHQDYTFGRLLKHFDTADRPNIEAVFNFEKISSVGEFSGLKTEMEDVERQFAINPLFLSILERKEGLELNLTFQTELFSSETVEHWLCAYASMLEETLRTPEATIGELASTMSPKQMTLLNEWNSTQTDYPRNSSISQVFDQIAEDHPKNIALQSENGAMSYANLKSRVDSIASKIAGSGVKNGERVVIFLDRSEDQVASSLACLRSGAVAVPIDPSYPYERVTMMLDDCEATLVLTSKAHLQRFTKSDVPTLEIESIRTAKTELDIPYPTPETAAYAIYTSGSTGKPKGAVLTHRSIVRLVKNSNYVDFGPESRVLYAANPCFDASLFEIYGPLLNGGTLGVPAAGMFDVQSIATSIQNFKVNTLWLTVGLFQVVMDESPEAFSGLRTLITGGDVLPKDYAERFLNTHPNVRLVNGYGPTENTTFTTSHTVVAADLEKRSLPIGRPLSNSTVWILDPEGHPVAPGIPGELCTGGDGVAIEYLNRPELTREKFIPDTFSNEPGARLYRSGDLCRYRADGTLEFLGRIDNQVKIRGFRVEPGEIESSLTTLPLVKQCKVVVRGEGAGEKSLIAYVTPINGKKPEPGELTSFLQSKFPGYMIPSACVVLDRFPVNKNGKIDVHALPAPLIEIPAVSQAKIDGEASETEVTLTTIWADLLGCADVGLDDDFFQLGGHSLLGMRMFARIQKEFDLNLPLGTLFRAPTIRQLGRVIDSKSRRSKESSVLPEIAETPRVKSVITPVSEIAETTIAVQPKGDFPAIFGIHGGDGGIMFYRSLALQLGEDRPFYAFESPSLTAGGEIPDESVEETASRYITEMKKVQQSGPYLLCGYSFGGVVAYEMAAQLRRQGEEISFLGLFDTENPHAAAEAKRFSIPERIAVNWNERNREGAGFFEKFGNLTKRFGEGMLFRLKFEAEGLVARNLPPADTANWIRQAQVRQAYEKAMDVYCPPSIDCDLTLYRAMVGGDKFDTCKDYGWKSVVSGKIEIIDIPGNHISVFDEENVDQVAEAVRSTLPILAK